MGNCEKSVTRWVPGVVSATFRKMPLSADEILEICRECGLQAIEWSENAHVQAGDAEGARALGEKTRAAGLRIAAYGSYYRLGEQEDVDGVFSRSLISAKALGADVIRVWAGTKASEEVSEDERKRLTLEARRIAEKAQAEGIRVAFEWHKNTLTDTNASAERLIREADHPNLCCLWQPTVALTPRERVEGIRRMQGKLVNFHVYSWPDGKRGPLNAAEWQFYLDAGAGLGGEHFALLEFVRDDSLEQFRQDAQVLVKLLDENLGV
ncbi:MAG: sugar phosphate isomerase/epimerase [Clostridia bacterium]|nr:sugar phosphate isomerase/epimerase [Clostridia bacterium]